MGTRSLVPRGLRAAATSLAWCVSAYFMAAAAFKVVRMREFLESVASRWPEFDSRVALILIGVSVPSAEVLVGILTAGRARRRQGAWLAIALLVVFSAGVLWNASEWAGKPCSCTWRAVSELLPRGGLALLLRNAVLAGMAIIVVIAERPTAVTGAPSAFVLPSDRGA